MKTTTEDIRLALRDALYATQGVPRTEAGLRRALRTELGFDVPPADITAACEFWKGLTLPQMDFRFDEAGSTKWWHLTSAGILAKERS